MFIAKLAYCLTTFMMIYLYTLIDKEPRVNWTNHIMPYNALNNSCQEERSIVIFGATSMLGEYIIDTFKQHDLSGCYINIGRSKCSKCDMNISADIRDIKYIDFVLEQIRPSTIIASVKPPLTSIHYRRYIEINLLSLLEIAKTAKRIGVKQFIYVSSIAASNHYIEHHNTNEKEHQLAYTQYEAPYDISKRVFEDFILSANDENFNTISIRTSGIFGGDRDPFMFLRYPIIIKSLTPVIDINYAGNIAEALYQVTEELKVNPSVGGQFYYYTGKAIPLSEIAEHVAKIRNLPLVVVTHQFIERVLNIWSYFIIDHHQYSEYDIYRMGTFEQTFDQTKFYTTFTKFTEPYEIFQSLNIIYGGNKINEVS